MDEVKNNEVVEPSMDCRGKESASKPKAVIYASDTQTELSSVQMAQIRELIRAQYEENNATLCKQHICLALLAVLLATLMSTVAAVCLKRINALEADIMNLFDKAVDTGFDAAFALVEVNPELLRDDDGEALLRLAERELRIKAENLQTKTGNSILNVKNADELLRVADDYYKRGQYLRAMTLYRLSHEQFMKKKRYTFDKAIRISLTMGRITATVRPLSQLDVKSRDSTVVNFAKNYMYRLKTDLTSLEDVNRKVKALILGRCIGDLAQVEIETDNFQKALLVSEEGIQIMKNEFSDTVSKYQYYGYLLHSRGTAYEFMNDYVSAERIYAAALEAKRLAVDYPNIAAKQSDIRLTNASLVRARDNL